MNEFKQIQRKIEHLQYWEKDDSLTQNGQELINELQRIKKEHFEMLEMLKEIKNQIEDGITYVTKEDIEQLIKQATEL